VLHWRLSLGTVLILALCGLFWFDSTATRPGAVLLPIAILVSLLASGEFIRLTAVGDLSPRPSIVRFGSLFIVIASGGPYLFANSQMECPLSYLGIAMLAFITACFLATLAEVVFYKNEKDTIPRLGLTVLGLFYVGMLIGILTLLRFVSDDSWKSLPLISLILTVKMSDIGAYTVGRLIGKHRLAPQLSPGKTIEGVAGGLLFGLGGSYFSFRILPDWMQIQAPQLNGWNIVVYGLLMGLTGVVGDLAESLLKRGSGNKDSSGWLPGFGGVLDLLDSLLLAGPASYIYWLWITR